MLQPVRVFLWNALKSGYYMRMSHIVLDRDGTLIRHIPYLHDSSQVELLPTVREGLEALLGAGHRLYLHTNQSGIGRGQFTLEQAVACNDAMLRLLDLGTDLFRDMRISPERPDEEVRYRKPSPNFGRELLAKYGISEDDLYYLGDNVTDLLTARNIGCRGAGVDTGGHDLRRMLRDHGLEGEYPVFDRFIDAAEYVIAGGSAGSRIRS